MNEAPGPCDVRIALVTAPDAAVAERIVLALVEDGLAVCGNIVQGVTSIYRWQSEVHRDAEVLIILKTTGTTADRLIHKVAEIHPYEVPEVLILPVESGHPPYLAWVVAGCATAGSETP